MRPIIKYSLPPITEADIIDFEHRHNLTLPEDYRQFLLETNGGQPFPGGGEIYGEDDYFLGLSCDPDWEDMSLEYDPFAYSDYEEDALQDDSYPGRSLKIAIMYVDSGSIGLCLKGENTGKVFCHYPGSYDGDFVMVANNFTEFLESADYGPRPYDFRALLLQNDLKAIDDFFAKPEEERVISYWEETDLLATAVELQHLYAIQRLRAMGVNSPKYTLHRVGNLAVAQFMLADGVGVNDEGSLNVPPLVYAARGENLERVKLLVENGGDLSAIRPRDDKNLLEIAEERLEELLRSDKRGRLFQHPQAIENQKSIIAYLKSLGLS